jgi:uncharacterized membrane protein YeaQ/YmgE (transglycosylase-associated protein family)
MTLLEVALYLLVAGLAGALGQTLAGYSHRGCLASIAIGFVGALLGSWLAGLLHLPEIFVVRIDGHPFPVVWAIAGSALFVAILGAFSSGRRPPPASA